ncbi:MAG: hypothetical protein RKP20_17485 [Candidatus Competibacter sp.]|nr:hypothetical protein [Candidatus Competibacter sp.]
MFSMNGGLFRLLGLLLIGVLLASCGGGGGSDGGFTNAEKIQVSITADKTTLQTNPSDFGPDPSGPFTNTLTVRITRNGNLFPAPSVAIDIVSGLSSGALYYLDGDPAHEQCPTGATCPPDATVPIAFRRLTFEDTTGVVTAHFHSSGTPGTVVLKASAPDPNTGEQISANLTLTVGPGASTGLPAEVLFSIPATPLYITGQGRTDVKQFQVAVLDDGQQPVPNPTANNVQLQLLPNRPNGGEQLVAVTISGATQQGTVVNTRTINGVAAASLHSGTLPGTVGIVAIADRADNNVDNGIQQPVTDVDTVAIGSGQIVSLTFTGPYPGAVAQRFNTLPLGDGDSINFATGVYSRAISVIAADEFGNPPAPGKFVTFRLMDNPMTGYPDQGRGTFTITGEDGNPVEGGNTFSTPTSGSSLAGTTVNCQLVLEGGQLGQEGGWIVTGVSGLHLLSVNTPFIAGPDTGFTVPYTVGCPPYSGNVANNVGGATVQLDSNGLASTIMNYPINQLGRCFKLTVEANGGTAGAVMNPTTESTNFTDCRSWYLGIADGSALTVIPESDLNFTVPVGEEITKVFTLQLFDGGTPPAPLPAEVLSVQTVITDPDHDAFVAAENAVKIAEANVEAAQDALDNFAAANSDLNVTTPVPPPGTSKDCFLEITTVVDPGPPPITTSEIQPNPSADPRCSTYATLQDNVSAAELGLATAQAARDTAKVRDDLYTPKATFTPNPLVTGAQGIATMTVVVSDLYTAQATGGTGDSQVQFFISTVGPEIVAPTITITVTPQGGGG